MGNRLLQILSILFPILAFAGPKFDLRTPVVVDGTPSNKLFHAPFDDLATTVMYTNQNIISRHTKALFIMFGGTGARSHSHGIGATMGGLAMKVRGILGDAIAFQNPLYFQDHLSDTDRATIIRQFTPASAQTSWMAKALEYAIAPTLDEKGNPKIPIYLFTRSSGTLVAGQLSDDYFLEKPGSEIFGKLTGWIGSGLLPHEQPHLDQWIASELELFLKAEQKVRDENLNKEEKDRESDVIRDEIVRRIQKEHSRI
ncbi:MAG: hypothetical protein K2X47_19510 [Bdellovibrionales bacterium]|nr:hypothetical protein [Bdellovibrionales bacterium]